MKIFNKIIFLLAAVLVLGLSSCEKKTGTGPLITTLGTGAYVTLNKSINTYLNYSDLNNTTVSIEVKEYGNPGEKVITYVSTNGSIDKSTWKPVGEFPLANGVATLVVSAKSIASALGVQPTDLAPGNSYTLFNEVVTKDGRSFSIANTNTDVEGNSNYNMALRWSASVICPFVAADAAGTYKITRDDWDGSVGATVEATATDKTLTLTYAFPAAANPGKAPITITIDQATGAATVAKQVYGSYGTGYENFACQGTGLVFSCAGKVTLRLQHLLGSSDYGTYPLQLQKQ
ncbi:hypothetical protein ACFSQD_11985 [Flavihumibacter stibioxidans]|uniref:DUF1735 domain-containing protein n=1 Tax=Flavihumibacter stibioxidans TaxID=1834163 RepID=A0ABR7MA02_9BACT|nr:hypothetical protein [Flavihumibacter stibioxidans]MBC6491654.1 hypothetical protein [Flavihumibacter stibioxidans]